MRVAGEFHRFARELLDGLADHSPALLAAKWGYGLLGTVCAFSIMLLAPRPHLFDQVFDPLGIHPER